jgi:hypothetical protein
MSKTEAHPSDVVVAKLLLGKASEEEARAAAAHAADCSRCRAELDAAQAARRRFAEQVFPRTLPEIERRLGPRPRWRFWLGALGVATAAIVILPFLVVRPRPPVQDPAWQTKGVGTLKVFGRRGDRVIAVEDGARLRPGDQLRFAVQPGDARFVLIGSVDGRGRASLYYPSAAVGVVDGGQVQLLEESIVLDDASGPERIFAVFSDRRLEDGEVEVLLKQVAAGGAEAIRRTHRLPLSFPQASLFFEKDDER